MPKYENEILIVREFPKDARIQALRKLSSHCLSQQNNPIPLHEVFEMPVLVDKHTRMEVSDGTLPIYVHIRPKMGSNSLRQLLLRYVGGLPRL